MPNSNVSRTTPETQEESDGGHSGQTSTAPWIPPGGTLGELVTAAWKRAGASAAPIGDAVATRPVSFAAALRCKTVAVIAEVKRGSPSKGAINPTMDCARQAIAYAAGGAAAVSVLTEPDRFGGNLTDIVSVRSVTGLPLLRKDFLVAESQLAEAVLAGASAALLIVRAIEPGRLAPLARFADGIGLEILFEIRDETELSRALDAGATIIGVNNRNLETLVIDSTTVERILPLIPQHCIAIAESGYATREQVAAAGRAGADAVLIGSSFSASADPAEAVRAMTGVAKVGRD